MTKKKYPALRLLGADGAPLDAPPTADANSTAPSEPQASGVVAGAGTQSPAEAGAAVPAPVPVEPRVVSTADGPLSMRTKIEFDKSLGIGGPHAGDFLKGVDAVVGSCQGFALRLVELMILGAQRDEGALVTRIVNDALLDMRGVRMAVESVLLRLAAGQSAAPKLVVAQEGDVPPPAVKPS